MQITFRRRNMEITDALRTAATEKVSKLSRFLPDMDHAEISFIEERNPRIARSEICEVTVSGHGHHVRAKASAADANAAIDLVIDKLEQQLTKLKGKLAGHPHRHEKYRNGDTGLRLATAPRADGSAGDGAAAEAELDDNVAKIVKTKLFSLTSCTPDDAALQMDLLQHDFYVFSNVETQRTAVIYRRDDGHLGLIDVAV